MLPQDGAQRRGPDGGINASSTSTLEAPSVGVRQRHGAGGWGEER